MRMHMPALVRTMATISVVWVAAAQPAHGQFGLPIPGLGGGIVFDPTNFARNVLHYERRLEQIKMQQQQLEAQLNAMLKLRNPNWRDIQLVLARIETIMREGEALAYNLRTIDAEFQRTFPGTEVYRDYPVEETTQAARTLATLRGALNASRESDAAVPAGLARLEAMKRQMGEVKGHEQALELNGTIGMYSAEELTLLRQALAAQTNVQAIYFANRVNAESQAEATVRANLAAMSAPGPRYPGLSLQVTP